MDRKDAIQVLKDLLKKTMILGDDYIITYSGYKITRPDKIMPISEDELD